MEESGQHRLSLKLGDDKATAITGNDIAVIVGAPCTIHLAGDLGTGKTALARAIIQALAGDSDTEVPSPTFSLVLHYEGQARGRAVEILHADLYRIGNSHEVAELGLTEMVADRIVLIEWPEKGGDELPEPDMVLALEPIAGSDGSEGRLLTISASRELFDRLERSMVIRGFLDSVWEKDAKRRFLLGDASTRSYEKVTANGKTRIVMNAPRQPDGPPIRDGKPYSQIAHLAEDVSAFVGVGRILEEAGLVVPEIFGADLDAGLLLISDLGSGSVLDPQGRPIADRYRAAAEMLAHLHQTPLIREAQVSSGQVHQVPDYDRDAMMIEVELLLDWYVPAFSGRSPTPRMRAEFVAHWDALFSMLQDAEKHLVLRDFHSPNILWQNEEAAHRRIGLIDFQDAMIGPCAYDVASLAQDARVDVSAELEMEIVNAYITGRSGSGDFDETGFRRAYAIMAAQRATKIMGIFVRLDRRDGKPGYLKHLPRMRACLERNLAHPALHAYRGWLGSLLNESEARVPTK